MSEAVINHLSKEIEICVNNSVAFRMKSAFTVWVGPILLVSLVIFRIDTDNSNILSLNSASQIALVTVGMMYLALGVCAGRIEMGSVKRANELREMLIKVANESGHNFSDETLKDKDLEKWVIYAYTATFIAFGVVFLSMAVVITEMFKSVAT